MGLKIGLQKVAPTLRTDVGRSVLMHALVGAEAAAVGEHHGAGWAHLSRGSKQGESVRRGLTPFLLTKPPRLPRPCPHGTWLSPSQGGAVKGNSRCWWPQGREARAAGSGQPCRPCRGTAPCTPGSGSTCK